MKVKMKLDVVDKANVYLKDTSYTITETLPAAKTVPDQAQWLHPAPIACNACQ